MKLQKIKKPVLTAILLLLFLLNFIAYFHAYKFTHYSSSCITKTNDAKKLSFFDKVQTLIFGVNNPRPINKATPAQSFETINLQSNEEIECWYIKTENAKGTIILFHGYSGEKSSMLDKSDEFLKLGYNTVLVDFMGCGGSKGNQTTVGFKEAENVKTVFNYLSRKTENKIYLFGTSLGAVAIMKAINDYNLNPQGLIIECPFGSMYKTTCARFNSMKIPSFPMASLLVFWGGIQNGFWAFSHNPTEYAKRIQCPTLLLYGEQDEKVSRQEIDEIYSNLAGLKKLKTYPLAGHENYLIKYRQKWTKDVREFIQQISN